MSNASPLLVFVSGPYTAPTLRGVLDNIERAEAVGVDVIRAGHYPLIPHSLSNGVHEAHTLVTGRELSWEWWMGWCEAQIARCDVVLKYADSPGADREEAFAVGRGIPVIAHVVQLAVIARRRAA